MTEVAVINFAWSRIAFPPPYGRFPWCNAMHHEPPTWLSRSEHVVRCRHSGAASAVRRSSAPDLSIQEELHHFC